VRRINASAVKPTMTFVTTSVSFMPTLNASSFEPDTVPRKT
jgi:hypothetical protein